MTHFIYHVYDLCLLKVHCSGVSKVCIWKIDDVYKKLYSIFNCCLFDVWKIFMVDHIYWVRSWWMTMKVVTKQVLNIGWLENKFCFFFTLFFTHKHLFIPYRWGAPISIALHAPGTDFLPTINSIKYLRDCAPEAALVRQFTTFHIYFSSKHVPKAVSIRTFSKSHNKFGISGVSGALVIWFSL